MTNEFAVKKTKTMISNWNSNARGQTLINILLTLTWCMCGGKWIKRCARLMAGNDDTKGNKTRIRHKGWKLKKWFKKFVIKMKLLVVYLPCTKSNGLAFFQWDNIFGREKLVWGKERGVGPFKKCLTTITRQRDTVHHNRQQYEDRRNGEMYNLRLVLPSVLLCVCALWRRDRVASTLRHAFASDVPSYYFTPSTDCERFFLFCNSLLFTTSKFFMGATWS